MRLAAFLVTILFVATLSGEGDARSTKGDGPTTLTVAFGSLWVGTGGGDIIRIDGRTGREITRFRDRMNSVHGLVAAHGAIWAVRYPVTRIDPRRTKERAVPGTGSAAWFTAQVGAGALWLASDGIDAVLRIDPRRRRGSALIRVPGRAMGLAAGPRDILVVSAPFNGPVTGPSGPRVLHRIDPRTNRLSGPLVQLDCDPGVAIGRNAAWTADPCAGSLVRRHRRSLRPTGARPIPCWHQWCVPVLGFSSVWLVGGERVLRIDPQTLRVTASIRVRGAMAAVGAGAVWVLDYGDGTRGAVRRIDPRTNRVIDRIEVTTKS